MKREEIEKVYNSGKDAVVDLIVQLVDRIEKLEAGEASLGQVSYINTGANSRIIPISESLLTELQARYLKFYRSKLNLHEYQDNRPGYWWHCGRG